MFSDGLKAILLQVITSWQVIAVTLALVLFIYLVNYVARSYHRPRLSKSKPQKVKKAKPEKQKKNPDELDLEE